MEIFAAVDIETTGLDVGRHEILDIAIVPLNSDFTIDVGMPDFSARIRAEHPETAELQALQVNGLNPQEGISREETAADFRQWLVDCSIEKIIPVAHNLEFDMKFIRRTFPMESKVFSHHGRDSMRLALAVNDIVRRESGEDNFPSVSLRVLKDALNVAGEVTHHAVEDAKDAATVYRRLTEMLTQA
ncbi:MAG: 3'-5' exonuclease [Victivallaceae bacterium]|nr:3'-5' exonuclease [Victivallaceae bacterium]